MIKRTLTFAFAILAALTLAKTATAATVSINPPAAPAALVNTELQAIVTIDQPSVRPPADALITFIVTNTGANIARNVSIDNLLPVEFSYLATAEVDILRSLGELNPGDSVTKSVSVRIPSTTRTNRYVDEAIVSADNADSIESTVTIDVTNGQVLGATDSTIETLPVTGQSPLLSLLSGLLFIGSGALLLKLR